MEVADVKSQMGKNVMFNSPYLKAPTAYTLIAYTFSVDTADPNKREHTLTLRDIACQHSLVYAKLSDVSIIEDGAGF